MKELYKLNEQAGDAKIEGSAGVDSENVVLTLTVRHPHKIVTDKLFAFVDAAIDKLEVLLPGDQKQMAANAKAEVREFALNLLGVPEAPAETPAEVTPEQPAQTPGV